MTTGSLSFESASRAIRAALESFLARHPLPDDGPLWLAASGGTDSTALVEAAAALAKDGRLAGRRTARPNVVHVDHGQHDGSAHAAEQARALAFRHGLGFRLLTADLPRGCSEERMREARLALFGELGPGAVWTAHHADDQLETLWFRAERGTGRRGLAGIPESRGTPAGPRLDRPLLTVPRASLALLTAALPAAFAPVEDPSNSDVRIRRNRIRHVELPRWRSRVPDHERTEARALRLAARIGAVYAAREASARTWLGPRVQRLSAHRLDLAGAPRELSPPVWLEVGRLLHRTLTTEGPTDAWLRRFATLQDAPSGHRLQAGPSALTLRRSPTGLELRVAPTEAHHPNTDRVALPTAPHTPVAWGDGFELRRRPLGDDSPLWVRAARDGEHAPSPRGGRSTGRRPVRELLREARIPVLDRAAWPLVVDAEDQPVHLPLPPRSQRSAGPDAGSEDPVELARPSGSVDLPPTAYWHPCGRPHPSGRFDDERPVDRASGPGSAHQSAWIT